jgi:diguanylate cyclase (GGDEF)-like protein
MKRFISAIAILVGWSAAALAATTPPLTTVRAIRALGNQQASQSLPVAFQATVTYFRSYERTLFLQDDDAAIYVRATTNAKLIPGDRVLVRGVTRGSFRTDVVSDNITLLGHGAVPKPLPVTFDQAIRGETDCMLVSLRGVVRTADVGMSLSATVYFTNLQILTDGGYIAVTMDSDGTNLSGDLLDSEVEITGVISGKFDGKMQQTGILLHVPSLANVKILKRAAASPWDLPLTRVDEVLHSSHVEDSTQRVRVEGTVTYYRPGSELVLQNGSKSLWIMTETHAPLQLGDLVDASGFPDVRDGFLTLTRAEVRDTHVQAPVAPVVANWQKLASSGNIFDLVSIEGLLLTEVREATQDNYLVLSDGHLFSAIYRHANVARQVSPPPMRQVPLGSRVRITGICMLKDSTPFNGPVPFDILMRSFDDIAVVAKPSWLNIRNLTILVAFLLFVVFAVSARGWALERKFRRQTAMLAARTEAEAALERRMAQLEQRRSRILEDINGSRPLAEILEQIVNLSSFRLGGAPCWCEVTDGARLGAYPAAPESLRLAREPILARSGARLGLLFAGFDPATEPTAVESEALSLSARLATLAIETRRLYSDLLHRSEFDQLTDLHNRFSLDKLLESRIEQARENAGIFGLIYIDLDKFKQVNDLYGHQVGDLYLQEVAARMKRQLRSHDLLARLGGDEFTALVSSIPSRGGIEEIAGRLERCFDEPFTVEGYTLQGSASVGIAVYPEDGATKDSLLSAADAAMYVAKHTRHSRSAASAAPRKGEPAPGQRP